MDFFEESQEIVVVRVDRQVLDAKFASNGLAYMLQFTYRTLEQVRVGFRALVFQAQSVLKGLLAPESGAGLRGRVWLLSGACRQRPESL